MTEPFSPIRAGTHVHALEFLSDAQRRAILHDNAARFLRLPA